VTRDLVDFCFATEMAKWHDKTRNAQKAWAGGAGGWWQVGGGRWQVAGGRGRWV